MASRMQVGSALRILTACAAHERGALALCDHGGLPALVKLLQRSDTGMQGNAALCLAECAKNDKCLAVLAVLPIVPPLLAIAHNGKSQLIFRFASFLNSIDQLLAAAQFAVVGVKQNVAGL